MLCLTLTIILRATYPKLWIALRYIGIQKTSQGFNALRGFLFLYIVRGVNEYCNLDTVCEGQFAELINGIFVGFE